VTIADEARRVPNSATLGKIAELLERNGIDVDEIGKISRVSVYQGMTKNADGEAEVHDLFGVQISPAFEAGPAWPPVQPGPAVRLPKRVPGQPKQPGKWNTAVILPDIQAGYYRSATNDLEPIHDEKALAVALQIVGDVKPNLIVMVGDNADLCEFGKYRQTPAYARTTQATIDRLTLLLAQLRDAAPPARIVWLEGNHEARLPNVILDNMAAAYGLRKGNIPDGWPVLSIPYLCRFDDYSVEYLPGYPASSFWINERLKVIHGDKVASGGSTAHKYLATEKVSVIYGHVHRREYAARTRTDFDGPKEIMAASPGCLARIDGAVPSTKGGTDLDGRPVVRHEDWQQSIALVDYEEGDGRFTYQNIAIHDGWAMYGGKEYQA